MDLDPDSERLNDTIETCMSISRRVKPLLEGERRYHAFGGLSSAIRDLTWCGQIDIDAHLEESIIAKILVRDLLRAEDDWAPGCLQMMRIFADCITHLSGLMEFRAEQFNGESLLTGDVLVPEDLL